MDPVAKIAELAKYYGIGCHVDCSSASFITNFSDELDIGKFEAHFKTPGITSIGVSTSRYGLGPFGSSGLLYRTRQLRRYQYYTKCEWNGGTYCTPTLSGSRYGSAIVGTWCKIMSTGKNGYRENANEIVLKTKALHKSLTDIGELKVLTQNPICVVAFLLQDGDTYGLADFIRNEGVDVVNLINPPAISFTVTLANLDKAKKIPQLVRKYIEDYAKEPTLFDQGVKDYYKDISTMRQYSQLIHEVPDMLE